MDQARTKTVREIIFKNVGNEIKDMYVGMLDKKNYKSEEKNSLLRVDSIIKNRKQLA